MFGKDTTFFPTLLVYSELFRIVAVEISVKMKTTNENIELINTKILYKLVISL